MNRFGDILGVKLNAPGGFPLEVKGKGRIKDHT